MSKKQEAQRAIDVRVGQAGTPPGAVSSSVSVSAPPAVPTPPPPTDLALVSNTLLRSAVTPTALVSIQWRDASGPNVASYMVEVATDSGFTANVSQYPAAQQSAALELATSTTYYIRVYAVNGALVSSASASISVTTVGDTTPPAVPTSISWTWATGDLVISWTNPTSANFRDVEVKIYTDATKTTLLWTDYSAVSSFVWTVAMNRQATSNAPDSAVYVELRSRSWGGVFSSSVTPASQPSKAAPATPGSATTSWTSDTGTAGADCVFTWSAVPYARYRLTIDGVAHETPDIRFVYAFEQNRTEHSGTADPVLAWSLIAIDPLDQVSTAATGTATNAAPPAPTSVTLTAGFSLLVARVAGTPPADLASYEYVWKLNGVAVRTLESVATEQQYEATASGSYTCEVRLKDAFGQYSAAPAVSAATTLDVLTIDYLRAGAIYTDSYGNSASTLAALKDGTTASGGVTYSAPAHGVRTPQMATTGSGTSNGITIPKPTDAVEGDLLITQIAITSTTATITPPSGWTLLRKDNHGSSSLAQAIYYKRATNIEPASYGWGFSATIGITISIHAYTGVAVEISPADTTSFQSNSSSTSCAASAGTVNVGNQRVLFFGAAVAGSRTWTPPSGMTERSDASGSAAPAATVADVIQTGTGTTGSKTATLSSSAANVATLVVLRPMTPWIQIERPLIDRYLAMSITATAGIGYIAVSSDYTNWYWYSGALAVDGRTLTLVSATASALGSADERTAQINAVTLPTATNGRLDLTAMREARFVRLYFTYSGVTGFSSSLTMREFYARRYVQTDDLDAQIIRGMTISAGQFIANTISGISADLGSITAGTITGALIRTAASGARAEMDSTGFTTYDSTGAVQVKATTATDGELWAAGGDVKLGDSGLILNASTITSVGNKVRFLNSLAAEVASLRASYNSLQGITTTDLTGDNSVFSLGRTTGVGATPYQDLIISGTTQLRVDNTGLKYPGALQKFAGGSYRTGGIYVPITPAAILSNATVATGTTAYNVTSYGVPSGALAVHLRIEGQWSAASSGSTLAAKTSGGSTWEVVIGAEVANMPDRNSGNCGVSSNQIDLVVAGASVTGAYVFITGYYL